MSSQAPQFVPLIEQNDFPAFRHIMDQGFRNKYRNYADWTALQAEWAEQNGEGQAVPVMVNAIQLSMATRRLSDPPDLAELLDFASRIGETSSA